MLLQDISQIDPLPRHPVRNHRVRDQGPNPVRGWDGKPEVIAFEGHPLKSDRPSKRVSRKLARLVTVSRLVFTDGEGWRLRSLLLPGLRRSGCDTRSWTLS